MRLLTVAEAAEIARCSAFTIRRWISCGMLPAAKPGRGFLIKESDLLHLLQRPPVGLEEHVRQILADAPALTEEQLQLLRTVLGRRP